MWVGGGRYGVRNFPQSCIYFIVRKWQKENPEQVNGDNFGEMDSKPTRNCFKNLKIMWHCISKETDLTLFTMYPAIFTINLKQFWQFFFCLEVCC